MLIGLEVALGIMWLAAIGLLIVKTVASAAMIYRIQSAAEVLIVILLALRYGDLWLWINAALIIVVKILVIPRLVIAAAGSQAGFSGKSPWGVTALLLAVLGLSTAALLAGHWLGLVQPPIAGLVLAVMFVAFLHLSSRYEVWSLMWAMLSLDTAVSTGASLLSTRLPAVVDAGIALVSLALVFALCYVARLMAEHTRSGDVREMEELIG